MANVVVTSASADDYAAVTTALLAVDAAKFLQAIIVDGKVLIAAMP